MTFTDYQRLLAIAQAGLYYAKDEFDRERYEEIKAISLQLLANRSIESLTDLHLITTLENGYPTPKTDVRALIKKENKVLLVEDRLTKEWSLPGGFAEIGLSPKENILKEVKEETGLDVSVDQLIGVFDTNLNHSAPQLFQYYKLVFDCSIINGHFLKNLEVSNCDFFDLTHLPKLSEKRTSYEQLIKVFHAKTTYFE